MPRVQETTVYTFDELSDRAKEKAREWMRQGQSEDFDADCALDEIADVCGTLGITLDTDTVKLYGGGTRQKPQIYYSGFCSQGDGLSFTGYYRFRAGAVAKVKCEFPTDTTLHAIADTLHALQRRRFYSITCNLVRTSHHYSHEHTVSVRDAYWHTRRGDVEYDLPEAEIDALQDALRDLMRWGYRLIEAEYEYRLSDEAIDETIRANEYEFMEDGSRA